MGGRDEHESMAHLFPRRPTHADFKTLERVVAWVEDQKLAGRTPNQVYADLMDVESVAYLAVNRSGLDVPPVPLLCSKAIVEHASNSWMEGFLFGLLFQREKSGS